MKKCKRNGCQEPKEHQNRPGAGLCAKHAAEKRARQLYTASLPDCTRCNNKARKDDFLCGSCREQENQLEAVQQEEMQLYNDRLRIQSLEERLFQLEMEVRQLKQ